MFNFNKLFNPEQEYNEDLFNSLYENENNVSSDDDFSFIETIKLAAAIECDGTEDYSSTDDVPVPKYFYSSSYASETGSKEAATEYCSALVGRTICTNQCPTYDENGNFVEYVTGQCRTTITKSITKKTSTGWSCHGFGYTYK